MKLNLLHLIHGKTYSGGEHSLFLLYKYIDLERFNPVIVCLEDGLLARRLADLGRKVYCLGSSSRMPLALLPKIMRIAREERADIIINQTTRTTLIGRIVSLLSRKPNVTILQAPILRDTNTTKRRWVNHLLERTTGFLSARHIVVTRAIRDEMVGWGTRPEHVRVIYNSVDPDYVKYRATGSTFRKEFGIGDERPAAGMIASFRPRKGAEVLIRAMPRVLEEVPDAVLFMIGHGEWVQGKDYLEEIRRLVRSLGVEKAVVFTGFREDIPRILSELDLLVLPSLFGEGSSLTVLEAMGLGRPVVTTATEGNVELIEDGVTGILVPPGDHTALAKAVVSILRDRERAAEIGASARRRVQERFTADRMSAHYSALFEEVAGGDRNRSRSKEGQ
jgi:glycosyltransferase involved in cell wall biosynthesis